MGKLTPVDIFQEGVLRVWSEENDPPGVWFDGHDWFKWWPTLYEINVQDWIIDLGELVPTSPQARGVLLPTNEELLELMGNKLSLREPSTTHMPLVLLSLEESESLWFKLDYMSPNLWQSFSSSLERKEYQTSYGHGYGHPLKGPDQKSIVGTKHICTMTRRIGSHVLRVEGSLVYAGVGLILCSSMSQVFVDDELAGEAIMTAVKGSSPLRGAVHRRRPAYVSIGGLLLAVFAPHFKSGWFLVPPDVEIWLRATKEKLAGIPVTHHRYDSFAPNDTTYAEIAMDPGFVINYYPKTPLRSKDSLDRHVQVRGWIEEMSWLQHEHVGAKPSQGRVRWWE